MLSDLLLVLLCLAGTAFYAGIETGAISIHRMRLRHLADQGDRPARILEWFLDHPDRLLGTTLLGSNLCMVVASVMATSVGHNLLGGVGEALFGAAMTVVVLVFAEYLPKAWFQSHPIVRCRPFAAFLRYSSLALRPFVDAINWLTQGFIPSSFEEQPKHNLFSAKDELEVLARESEEHGMLSPKQRIMIRRVFELSGKTARDIMLPIGNVVVAKTSTLTGEFFDLVARSNHTRLPVYDDERKTYAGTVNFFDVMSECADSRDHRLSLYLRPPLFIPETTPLIEIFTRLRLSRQSVCLVVNPQSDVTGFITTQTVLEEIVGKL